MGAAPESSHKETADKPRRRDIQLKKGRQGWAGCTFNNVVVIKDK